MTTTAFPMAEVANREQRHRRRALVSIGILLFLSVSPVFGHHLARGTDTLLPDTDHIGELCLVALRAVLAPVHEGAHLLLVAGLAYASWDRLRAWLRMRRVLRSLDARNPAVGEPFSIAAARAGVARSAIRVVRGLPNPAFTAGFRRPLIYVAESLQYDLTIEQLSAVFRHEATHVRRRDPFRLSVLRFFARTLFWLPAFQRLSDDLADEAEITADDAAAGNQPLVLASAILVVASQGGAAPLVGAPGFTRCDILERRIRRLAGEAPLVQSHVTRRSIASAATALLLVWISGVAMVHPLGAQSGSVAAGTAREAADCTKHPGPVILHVFCDGISFASMRGHCPHLAP